MTNGGNDWKVSFARISWMSQALTTHPNVSSVARSRDIYFAVHRRNPTDMLNLLLLDEYVMSATATLRAFQEFPDVNIICLAGGWCNYSGEAKDLCDARKVGLFNTHSLHQALLKSEPWKYG